MEKFDIDLMHGITKNEYHEKFHLRNIQRFSSKPEWIYYNYDEDLMDGMIPPYRVKSSPEFLDKVELLFVHIVASLLKFENHDLIEDLANTDSVEDNKVKMLAILQAFYFFKTAREFAKPHSGFFEVMKNGNFFNDEFVNLYVYHFIVHGKNKADITSAGSNFAKWSSDEHFNLTFNRITKANQIISKLIDLDYFHEAAVNFYKEYAIYSGKTLEELQEWLTDKMDSSYKFTS